MSEDRLERALREMKEEDIDAGTRDTARQRVWDNLTDAGSATQGTLSRRSGPFCAEFRQDLRPYASHELGSSRRLLVEDHLSRCSRCRAELAAMNGERSVVARLRQGFGEASPVASSSRRVRWGALAAAAALFFAILYVGRDAIDGMMAPG